MSDDRSQASGFAGVDVSTSRTYLYQRIANDLRARISSGEFGRGQILPTEVELGARYGSSRITIRRALGTLREEGLLQSRRGFGWFVATRPLEHTLGQLGNIEQQVETMGRSPRRHIRRFGLQQASDRVAEVLGSGEVLRIDRLNKADEEVLAHSSAWVPATLASALSLDQVARVSLYDLLPVDIGGARQHISAVAASEEDAQLLGTPPGAPCLRSERVVYAVDGTPAVYAVAVFAGHRTEFLVQLPRGVDADHSQRADGDHPGILSPLTRPRATGFDDELPGAMSA